MGYFSISNSDEFSAYSSNPVAYSKLFVYRSSSDTLSPIFSDSGLTLMRANPMVADANGEFDLAYLMDGDYRVLLTTPSEVPILEVDGVEIASPLQQGIAHWFRNVTELKQNETLGYVVETGGQRIAAGDLLKVGENDFLYQVASYGAADHQMTTAGGVKLYVLPSADGRINIDAFGPTPTHVELQSAIDLAAGREIVLPESTTIVGSAPITGAVDVHLSGLGSLTWSGANIFETDGDIRLEGSLRISSGSGHNVIDGANVSRMIDIALRGPVFDGCLHIVDWRVPGTGDYADDVGISRMAVRGCRFTNGHSSAFLTDTRILSAEIADNVFEDQKTACTWIYAGTTARAGHVRRINIHHNMVRGVTSNNANDTAASAFLSFGQEIKIDDNIIDDISTIYGGSGVEVYAIYTKATQGTIRGNVISNLSNNADTSCFFVNVKGDQASGGSSIPGFGMMVVNNRFTNTADVHSVGVNMYSDRMLVSDNYMSGVGMPISHHGGTDFERNHCTGNVAVNPPATHNAIGMDWRASGGSYVIARNTLDGYDLGIAFRVNATDIASIEAIDNALLNCSVDAFAFYDSTGQGRKINKMIIRGGVAEATYLCRFHDRTAPDIEISDIDVSGIINKYLMIGDYRLQNGRIRNLTGMTHNFTDASSIYPLYLKLDGDVVATVEYRATAQSSDGTTYLSKKIVDTWSRIGGADLARLGTVNVVHEQKNGGDILVQNSGNLLMLRAYGVAGKSMNFRMDFDVQFSRTA